MIYTVLYHTFSFYKKLFSSSRSIKNMTMKTENIFLKILLISDSDREYHHVFIPDLSPFSFVLQTKTD